MPLQNPGDVLTHGVCGARRPRTPDAHLQNASALARCKVKPPTATNYDVASAEIARFHVLLGVRHRVHQCGATRPASLHPAGVI